MRMKINQLQDLLAYDPDTGVVSWRSDGVKKKAGQPAGSDKGNGYIQITVRPKNYLAHRVAWALHHGEWPENQIDHINGNRSDNRLCNLREVTNKQNAMNSGMRANNRSGVHGVSWDKACQKWVCRIRNGKVYRNLGRFDSLEKAKQVVESAKIEYGYSPRHGAA